MKKLLSKLGVTDREGLISLIKQFFKFGIIGVSNTLVHLGVYYILVHLGVHYILSNIAAFMISVLNAYFWNRKFVFKQPTKSGKLRIVKVYITYGTTFLLSTGLLYLQVDILGISELIAPILNICVTVPLNFLLNKFWAFK